MMSPSMQNLYDSIKNEPFKIPEDDGNDLTLTFFNPDREGWLLKIGEMKKLTPHHKPGLQDRTSELLFARVSNVLFASLQVVELKPGREGGSF